MGPFPNPFSIWLQYSCAKKIFGTPTKLHQILPYFVFNWQSLWMVFMLMHKNNLWSVGQWIDHHLESFHLVFLGCALWRVWFCYGHVLKPWQRNKWHRSAQNLFHCHLFFSLEAVSSGRPFSSTRLVYPPSSPRPASHSSNLARSCFARAAS